MFYNLFSEDKVRYLVISNVPSIENIRVVHTHLENVQNVLRTIEVIYDRKNSTSYGQRNQHPS